MADYLEVCSGCGSYRSDVAAARVAQPAAPRLDDETNRVARHNMAVGACWFVGGALVTLVAFGAAARGGTYFVATGAISYGLIRCYVGWTNYRR